MSPSQSIASSCCKMAKSVPIHDGPLLKFLVLVAVKLLKRWRPYRGNVLYLSKGLVVKYGRVGLSEAASMRFISSSTSIPVPEVLCAFQHRDQTYIVMERIDGDMLGSGWVKRSAASKAKLLAQLTDMIQEMRKIPPPQDGAVSSVDGGSLFDCRLSNPLTHFGPFRSVQDFHRYLRYDVNYHPNNDPDIDKLVAFHGRDWPLRFSHCDLSSLNVLARGDKIVAILDWETAGWFPAYWEYTTAC